MILRGNGRVFMRERQAFVQERDTPGIDVLFKYCGIQEIDTGSGSEQANEPEHDPQHQKKNHTLKLGLEGAL